MMQCIRSYRSFSISRLASHESMFSAPIVSRSTDAFSDSLVSLDTAYVSTHSADEPILGITCALSLWVDSLDVSIHPCLVFRSLEVHTL